MIYQMMPLGHLTTAAGSPVKPIGQLTIVVFETGLENRLMNS